MEVCHRQGHRPGHALDRQVAVDGDRLVAFEPTLVDLKVIAGNLAVSK
jgi:hypothetical protein